MNNNKGAFILGNVIVLAVILTICFMLSPEYTQLFYCSIAFITAAFVIEFCVNILLLSEESIKHYFFGLPLLYVTAVYITAASVAGIIFAVFLCSSFKAGFIIQLIILAVSVVCIIIAFTGKEALVAGDENTKTGTMRSLAARLGAIENMAKDRNVRAKIHSIYEMAKMANPMESTELSVIDSNIAEKTEALAEVVNNKVIAEGTISDIKDLINQRNSMCKSIKI